ncbi:MAG: hypothetical protein IBX57_00250 [Gammaproteobacteria bacterium]|nr:hypothetical protein [Gammaproteobacteria bacterium]
MSKILNKEVMHVEMSDRYHTSSEGVVSHIGSVMTFLIYDKPHTGIKPMVNTIANVIPTMSTGDMLRVRFSDYPLSFEITLTGILVTDRDDIAEPVLFVYCEDNYDDCPSLPNLTDYGVCYEDYLVQELGALSFEHYFFKNLATSTNFELLRKFHNLFR